MHGCYKDSRSQGIHIILRIGKILNKQINGNGDSYWENVRAGARLPTSSAPGKHDTFLTSVWDRLGGGGLAVAVVVAMVVTHPGKKRFLFKIFSQKLRGSGWRIYFLDFISMLLFLLMPSCESQVMGQCNKDKVNFGIRNAFISIKVNFVKTKKTKQEKTWQRILSSQINSP